MSLEANKTPNLIASQVETTPLILVGDSDIVPYGPTMPTLEDVYEAMEPGSLVANELDLRGMLFIRSIRAQQTIVDEQPATRPAAPDHRPQRHEGLLTLYQRYGLELFAAVNGLATEARNR